MNKIFTISAICGISLLSACSSNLFGSKPAPAPTMHAPVASETRDSSQSIANIKDIQTKLTQQGFYHGKIDGVWGPATENAVRGYQQKNNLTVNGKWNAETNTKMNDAPPPADTPDSSDSN